MSGECGSFLHASFLVMARHARQVQQNGETCRALHQGADRGTFKTYDEVPFPVARHGSIGCLCRTLADHDLGRNEGPAWLARAHPRHPRSSAPRQSPSRTVYNSLAGPLEAGLAIAKLLAHTDPDARISSSQPPSPKCCDDRLNPPRISWSRNGFVRKSMAPAFIALTDIGMSP